MTLGTRPVSLYGISRLVLVIVSLVEWRCPEIGRPKTFCGSMLRRLDQQGQGAVPLCVPLQRVRQVTNGNSISRYRTRKAVIREDARGFPGRRQLKQNLLREVNNTFNFIFGSPHRSRRLLLHRPAYSVWRLRSIFPIPGLSTNPDFKFRVLQLMGCFDMCFRFFLSFTNIRRTTPSSSISPSRSRS